jgi:hypothetical protein
VFHFDPFNAFLVLIAILASYRGWISTQASLKKDSDWHSEWIRRHSDECDERDRTYIGLLIELQKGNAHLTTLTEGQGERIARIETQMDRKR